MNKVCHVLVVAILLFVCTTTTIAFAGAYHEGDQGEDIIAIQKQLLKNGYNTGVVDGYFGPITVNAIKNFQKNNKLEVDGIIGDATYQALMGKSFQVSRGSINDRRIIQDALKLRGIPYVFGGVTPRGFDCSGFVRHVFASNGIKLPRTADVQYTVGRAVAYNNLQPCDLVFFTTYEAGASHSGIYIGDGRFISATSSRGVAVDNLNNNYWATRYVGARRLS